MVSERPWVRVPVGPNYFFFFFYLQIEFIIQCNIAEEVQVGKDQEKTQSEKDSHSKNRGGKN